MKNTQTTIEQAINQIRNSIKPATKQQELQVEAAILALNSKFKEAIALMKESIGVSESETPVWMEIGALKIDKHCNQTKSVLNEFLTPGLTKLGAIGYVAISILNGHYGRAVNEMYQIEFSASQPREELPEDLDELLAYMEAHPVVFSANDPFTPSWFK